MSIEFKSQSETCRNVLRRLDSDMINIQAVIDLFSDEDYDSISEIRVISDLELYHPYYGWCAGNLLNRDSKGLVPEDPQYSISEHLVDILQHDGDGGYALLCGWEGEDYLSTVELMNEKGLPSVTYYPNGKESGGNFWVLKTNLSVSPTHILRIKYYPTDYEGKLYIFKGVIENLNTCEMNAVLTGTAMTGKGVWYMDVKLISVDIDTVKKLSNFLNKEPQKNNEQVPMSKESFEYLNHKLNIKTDIQGNSNVHRSIAEKS